MDFDDVWAGPTEKLEDKGRRERSLKPQQSMRFASSNSLPSLKKIQLLPLADELPATSLPAFESLPTSPSAPIIKPPPALFMDLWGESENPSSEHLNISQTETFDLDPLIEEQQGTLAFETALVFPEEKNIATIPLEQVSTLDELWEMTPEKTGKEWVEQATASLDDFTLLTDLDLFDIDAALAEQEVEVQQQEYEREKTIVDRASRFERWGGVSSLIYVNWENPETAEQDALARLGYANISLSTETRAFIIQAARNARLPHRQEILLTTQMANARAQLASLPPYNEEEAIDPYAARRQELRVEITEIEQTLTSKMQWVAIKKAVQFLGQGIELDDLIQIGMLGVIAGIQHFDITRKARLLIAVNAWTFQALARSIADYGNAIRLPAHMFEQVKALTKQHRQWQQAYGRLPTRQELAKVMNVSLNDLATILKSERILRLSKQALPIEHFASVEYAHEGHSFQTPEIDFSIDIISTDTLGEVNRQQIQLILSQCLTPREQQVFSLRVGLDEDGKKEGQTLEEIGRSLKITRERVRQIEEKAKKKLAVQLRKMYPVSSESQKSDENAVVMSDNTNAQQKTRNSKKKKLLHRSNYKPLITKKYLEEIKGKREEQHEKEARLKPKTEELKEAEQLFYEEYSHKPKWLK